MTGSDDAGIGDQQDFSGAEIPRQFTHALDGLNAEDDARARLMVEE